MKQKLLYLFLFLTISVTSFAQVANQPNDYVVCDDDNDGFALFDLTNADAQVLGSQQSAADYTVTYHETMSDAINGINAIYYPYVNNTDLQIIYVRLESNATGNFDTTIVNLIVNPIPQAIQPTALNLCDDMGEVPGDAITDFDLTIKDAEITNGNADWSVSYYETNADAYSQTNAITNPTAYTNLLNPQTLFVEVTDTNTGCMSFRTLTIRVLPNPSGAMGTPSDIMLCDDNNDGFTGFDLTLNEGEINPSGEPFTLSYFINEADALGNFAPILDPTNFINVSNPQTIYVRVETLEGCSAFTNFDISVNPLPEIYIESSYSFCVGESVTIDTALSILDYSFQWTLNGNFIPGESQPFLTVTQSGFYEVVLYSLLGCGTTTILINVEEIVCTDTDNDGVIDSDEDINENGNLEDDDTDDDGIPNYLDSDDDGDNVETIDEISIDLDRSSNSTHAFIDTDNDTIENYLDNDDDDDGVLTKDEDYNNNGDPTDDDTNINGIPDYLESSVALNVNQFSTVEFQLFPNPAKAEVTIQLANSNSGIGKINVFDIQGKIILKDLKLQVQSSTLDISSLETGLYFVELTIGNSTTIEKLIVN